MAVNQSARVVMHGTQPSGEIWETGFWVVGIAPADQAAAQVYCDSMANQLAQSVITDVKLLLSPAGAYSGIRMYFYPAGGNSALYVCENVQNAGPGTGGDRLPEQVAIVATLLTGAAGRRNRGRMYFPCTGSGVGDDLQFPLAVASDLAGDLALTFNDIGASENGVPSVYSGVAGTARPITSVRVDTKPDIQRRRANRQQPTGQSTQPVQGP